MSKSTRVIPKKVRKRPIGRGTFIGVRLQPPALAVLDAWIATQDDQPSRPEALRRLAERGLSVPATKRGRTK
jgi:hypothetical protein